MAHQQSSSRAQSLTTFDPRLASSQALPSRSFHEAEALRKGRGKAYRVKRVALALMLGSSLAACAGTLSDTGPRALDAGTPVAERSNSLLDKADRLLARGEYSAAIPIYRSSLSLGGARAERGFVRALLGHGQAGAAYDAATNSSDREILTLKGQAALALGRFDDAGTAFARAVARGAGEKAQAGLAISDAIAGNIGSALDRFSGLESSASEANRALVLIAADRPAEGSAILEDMIRAGQAGVKERQNLALAYTLMGRDSDALAMARLDLDFQTATETLGFYRELQALDTSGRLRALVLGVVDPAWTRRDPGNLLVNNTAEASEAGRRLVEAPVEIAAVKPEPVPEPEPEPEPKPQERVLPLNAPPLLEPEGWAVQIAAYRTIEELIRGWEILKGANEDILASIPPRRSEVDFGQRSKNPKGFFFRLNAGPLETLYDAKTLCDTLTARGTACWVRPPEPKEGKLPKNELAKTKPPKPDTRTEAEKALAAPPAQKTDQKSDQEGDEISTDNGDQHSKQ